MKEYLGCRAERRKYVYTFIVGVEETERRETEMADVFTFFRALSILSWSKAGGPYNRMGGCDPVVRSK